MTWVMSLHQRQVVGFPAGHATGQLGGGEAGLEQVAADRAGVLAHVVDHDQGLAGLVFLQLADAGGELVLRNVQRANDMASGEFLARADVDHQALVAVDQRGQLAIAQAAAAFAGLVDNQQDQQNQEDSNQQVVICREFNQMSNHRRVFQVIKNGGQYTQQQWAAKACRTG